MWFNELVVLFRQVRGTFADQNRTPRTESGPTGKSLVATVKSPEALQEKLPAFFVKMYFLH